MVFSWSQLSIIFTHFFLALIPYSASLTFNITSISPRNQNLDIVTEGDGAYISNGGIQLTPYGLGSNRTDQAGRATYIKPLHIWDNASRELVDFTTNFSFVIQSNSSELSEYADGLTFFLADNNSVITGGGAMGLPINPTTNLMMNPFVAVEFDTFWDSDWDQLDPDNFSSGDHVGIDVNSLASVRSEKWLSNITGGGECQAWIKYDSVSKNLSVAFTGFEDDTVVRQDELNYTIDLRDVLPEWVIFGFSASTGTFYQNNNIKSWSFNSSDLQIDVNNRLPSTTSPKKWKRYVVGLICVLSVLVIFLSVLAVLELRKKKKLREDEVKEYEFEVEMNKEFEMGTGPKRFSYQELSQATGEFAEKEKLGHGGFGSVYKGFLEDSSTYVAVKRFSKTSKQGIKEYASEIRIISRVRHKNLVQLIGWCHKKGELVLVYEYMENGSLDLHLFKKKSLLKWDTRYKIAHGLASALLYLHEEWEQCVLHRDIKSSNVMLDSNFNAKLGDFGLAKLVDHEKGSKTTMMAGTMGYIAPECVLTGKATKESDVFSFGVVVLGIACGRKPINYMLEEKQVRLVDWVWGLYGTGMLLEAADPLLESDFKEEEIKCLMIVGLWCVHPDSNYRASMRQVIQVLNFDASLPILPLEMPVATYDTPPTSS